MGGCCDQIMGQKSTERILACMAQMNILNTLRHRMSRSTIKILDVRTHAGKRYLQHIGHYIGVFFSRVLPNFSLSFILSSPVMTIFSNRIGYVFCDILLAGSGAISFRSI